VLRDRDRRRWRFRDHDLCAQQQLAVTLSHQLVGWPFTSALRRESAIGTRPVAGRYWSARSIGRGAGIGRGVAYPSPNCPRDSANRFQYVRPGRHKTRRQEDHPAWLCHIHRLTWRKPAPRVTLSACGRTGSVTATQTWTRP
jgi:hypothetical protein